MSAILHGTDVKIEVVKLIISNDLKGGCEERSRLIDTIRRH